MKNNYPIKYALMPMYEQTGWIHGLHELERDYNIVAYIVTKCYVISEIKKYSINGTYQTNYEVVFAYQKDRQHPGVWQREEPEFSFYSQCTNCTKVEKVFDSYEEASKEADSKNKNILKDTIFSIPYNKEREENIAYEKEKHQDTLSRYKELENEIKEGTQDLSLNEKIKEQTIIVCSENKDIVYNTSLYDYLYLIHGNEFYVCTVTEDEYKLMKQQIKQNGILDERNTPKTNYKQNRYLLASDSKNNIIRIFKYKEHLKIGSYYLTESTTIGKLNMRYDKNMPSFYDNENFEIAPTSTKIYTIETYEDIIKSYIPNYINETEEKQITSNIKKRKKVNKRSNQPT